jgi:hypothetical protein
MSCLASECVKCWAGSREIRKNEKRSNSVALIEKELRIIIKSVSGFRFPVSGFNHNG